MDNDNPQPDEQKLNPLPPETGGSASDSPVPSPQTNDASPINPTPMSTPAPSQAQNDLLSSQVSNNQPQVFVSGQDPIYSQPMTDNMSNVNTGGKIKKPKKKLLLTLGAVLVILIGGAAAFYFLVYMSPNFIWSQSLNNMYKGYNRLLTYTNNQSRVEYKGIAESGSFTATSGQSTYNGSLDVSSYGENTSTTFNLDLGVTTINFQERSIAVAGSGAPDVYIKISGIQSYLSTLSSDAGVSLNGINNQWIFIDHNLINDLENIERKQQVAQGSHPNLTWAEVNSYLSSIGSTNKKYLFSSNQQYALTKVVKKYGFTNVNGIKMYHYQVGFNKANIKSYLEAVCQKLQQSDFGGYLNQEYGSSSVSDDCKSLETSANNIKSSDTVGVWVNNSTRLIYKVRLSYNTNPAENYVDIGLNYKSSSYSSIPFFINGVSNSGGTNDSYSLTSTLNTKSNQLTFGVNAQEKGGSSPFNLTGSFNVKPSNTMVDVTVPPGAESIVTLANNLGLGQYITNLESEGSSSQSARISTGIGPIANALNLNLTNPTISKGTDALAALANLRL